MSRGTSYAVIAVSLALCAAAGASGRASSDGLYYAPPLTSPGAESPVYGGAPADQAAPEASQRAAGYPSVREGYAPPVQNGGSGAPQGVAPQAQAYAPPVQNGVSGAPQGVVPQAQAYAPFVQNGGSGAPQGVVPQAQAYAPFVQNGGSGAPQGVAPQAQAYAPPVQNGVSGAPQGVVPQAQAYAPPVQNGGGGAPQGVAPQAQAYAAPAQGGGTSAGGGVMQGGGSGVPAGYLPSVPGAAPEGGRNPLPWKTARVPTPIVSPKVIGSDSAGTPPTFYREPEMVIPDAPPEFDPGVGGGFQGGPSLPPEGGAKEAALAPQLSGYGAVMVGQNYYPPEGVYVNVPRERGQDFYKQPAYYNPPRPSPNAGAAPSMYVPGSGRDYESYVTLAGEEADLETSVVEQGDFESSAASSDPQ